MKQKQADAERQKKEEIAAAKLRETEERKAAATKAEEEVQAQKEAAQQAALAKKETTDPAAPPSESLEPVPSIGSLVYLPPKKIIRQYPNHLEANLSWEYLDPNKTYGSWENLGLAFYHKQSDSVTYSLQGGLYWRDTGDGMNIGAGIYKTWNKYLYTSSSVYWTKI